MNIFAAIKKSINSNLNKPLDITLDEIKTAIAENSGGVPKSTRHVVEIIGVPYNASTSEQVISESDDAIFSVEGSGRIMQIIPVTKRSSATVGTALLTVDGNTMLNNGVTYATSASDVVGVYIVDDVSDRDNHLIYTDILNVGSIYIRKVISVRANVYTYSSRATGISASNGIPFNNGFELRMTQSAGASYENNCGVIVIYELNE